MIPFSKYPYTHDEMEKVCRLYAEYNSISTISLESGIGTEYISAILAINNIEVRCKGRGDNKYMKLRPDLLKYIDQKRSNAYMMGHLGISEKTLKKYKRRIKEENEAEHI